MATLAAPAPTAGRAVRTGRATGFWRYLRRNPSLGVGLFLMLCLILLSTVGRLGIDRKKDPYPLAGPPSKPPSLKYPLGTDQQGRDLFAVMVVGTQLSMRAGLLAGSIGIVIATILGFVAAYYGGLIDAVIKWIVDVMLTIPQLLILIVIASTLKRYITVESMALIIASLAWIGPTRTIRSQVLSLRERPFVLMARLSGMGGPEIIVKELMPNLLPFILYCFVQATYFAILTAMGLEILGLGSQREPTLGMTLYHMQRHSAIIRGLWWWWLSPVGIIMMLVVGMTLVSLGLDEWANPRTRRAE
ncbi:MAG TPA: ABC transporter permease [Herpetosiphonaceae bacterium]|jgi:peptide/nickel transport system permease protein|nr:ABC transporter permease [Herpetosiphonaceae bacterium]